MAILVFILLISFCVSPSHHYLIILLGFIGADTFHFVYAGCLLALNTFGGEMCMMVTLLAVVRGHGLGQGPGPGQGLGQGSVKLDPVKSDPVKSDPVKLGPVKLDLTGSALAHWCGYRLWLLAATAGGCY